MFGKSDNFIYIILLSKSIKMGFSMFSHCIENMLFSSTLFSFSSYIYRRAVWKEVPFSLDLSPFYYICYRDSYKSCCTGNCYTHASHIKYGSFTLINICEYWKSVYIHTYMEVRVLMHVLYTASWRFFTKIVYWKCHIYIYWLLYIFMLNFTYVYLYIYLKTVL